MRLITLIWVGWLPFLGNAQTTCDNVTGNVVASSSLHPGFLSRDTICVGTCFKAWITNAHCDYFQHVPTFSWIFEGSVGNDSILGDTVTVCYNDTGTFWKWVFGSSTFSMDSSFGGSTVTVLPCPPNADLAADRTDICAGECVQYSDPLEHVADTWEWHFPGGVPDRHTGREPPPVCYPDTGLYDASVTVTSKWGATTKHYPAHIRVKAAPEPVAVDTLLRTGEGEPVTLNAPARGDSYAWEPHTGITVYTDTAITVVPPASTAYTATVANTNGCSVLRRYEVRVQQGLLVPTAFSPNGDGLNDRLRVLNGNVDVTEMAVWNRWGEPVYRAAGNHGWDGTFKGEPADNGVYVWHVAYTVRATGRKATATGTVTLVR